MRSKDFCQTLKRFLVSFWKSNIPAEINAPAALTLAHRCWLRSEDLVVQTPCHVSRSDVDQSDGPVSTPSLTSCQLVLLYLLALMNKCKNKRRCFCCHEQLLRLPSHHLQHDGCNYHHHRSSHILFKIIHNFLSCSFLLTGVTGFGGRWPTWPHCTWSKTE